MLPSPLRSYAAAIAAASSAVDSSSPSSFTRPPQTVFLDEEEFPALSSGGGGSSMRRRRHWRSSQGLRIEQEPMVAREEAEEGGRGDELNVPSPPEDAPPPPPSPETGPHPAAPLTWSPHLNPPEIPAAPRLTRPTPVLPSFVLPLTQLPVPPRPTFPQSSSALFPPSLDHSPPPFRRPLIEPERAHIFQVLEVSRDALHRLQHRDATREGRIAHLQAQINTMERLLRGGEEEEEWEEEPEGAGENAEAESVRPHIDRLRFTSERDDADLSPRPFMQMLPHSLLTGQVSLLRRRGAIHRMNATSSTNTASAAPPPLLPLPRLDYLPRPESPESSSNAYQRPRTNSRIRTSPLRTSLSGDAHRTSPPVDDPSVPARMRPSQIQLLSQQFAAAGRQWPVTSRSRQPPEGVHRPAPGKVGESAAGMVSEGGSWRLWCQGPGRRSPMRTGGVGPPAAWVSEAAAAASKEEQGCGALVVVEGAERTVGGLRFESREEPKGAGRWGKWEGAEMKKLEGETGSMGCACKKEVVSCLNCGRTLGNYIDASQPYHTHPVYTFSAERVASRFHPSSSPSTQKPFTTPSSFHHSTNASHVLLVIVDPPSNRVSSDARPSSTSASNRPPPGSDSDADSDATPEILPIGRHARLRDGADLPVGIDRPLPRNGGGGDLDDDDFVLVPPLLEVRRDGSSLDLGDARLLPPPFVSPSASLSSDDSEDSMPTLPFNPSRTHVRNPSSPSAARRPRPPSILSISDYDDDNENPMPIVRRRQRDAPSSPALLPLGSTSELPSSPDRPVDDSSRGSTLRQLLFQDLPLPLPLSITPSSINSLSASELHSPLLSALDSRNYSGLGERQRMLNAAAGARMGPASSEIAAWATDRREQQQRVRDCLDLETLRATRERVLGSGSQSHFRESSSGEENGGRWVGR